MRRALAALLLLAALGLTGCGDDSGADAAPVRSQASGGYSDEVRSNFLASCVENATRTAEGAASEEQLTQTCECILGKVEREYSEQEFGEFEQRLLGGNASDEESGRLVNWSTECAQEASS
jgi:hypothetical protein